MMRIDKYLGDSGKWYVKIDGVLSAGFINEKLANVFITALGDLNA